MASFNCVIAITIITSFTIITTIITPTGGASVEFKVGDAIGWQRPGVNQSGLYKHWASRKHFHVGDSLRFEYTNDSVLVVDKYGYYHCEVGRPIAVYMDGNSTVNLDTPGRVYFISGEADHCHHGQKLAVMVRAPPPIASPPHPSTDIAPAPSPTSGVSASFTLVLPVVVAAVVSVVASLFGFLL